MFQFEQKVENPTIEVPENNDETEGDLPPGGLLPSLSGYQINQIYGICTITFNVSGKTVTNSPTTKGYFSHVNATYVASGGTALFPQEYYLFTISMPSTGSTMVESTVVVPSATGYNFAGYYTAANGTGTLCVDSSGNWVADQNVINNNITLYAYWEDANATTTSITVSYSVYGTSFNSNSKLQVSHSAGTASSSNITANVDGTIKIDVDKSLTSLTFNIQMINLPTNISYYIKASLEKSNSTPSTSAGFSTEITFDPTETQTVYVGARQRYSVTFKSNYTGGASDIIEYKPYGGSVYAGTSRFSRSGYVFEGWYANSACTGDVYDGFYSDDQNITLYAKWQESSVLSTISGSAEKIHGVTSMDAVENTGSGRLISPLGEAYSVEHVEKFIFGSGDAMHDHYYRHLNLNYDFNFTENDRKPYALCKVSFNFRADTQCFDVSVNYSGSSGGVSVYFGGLNTDMNWSTEATTETNYHTGTDGKGVVSLATDAKSGSHRYGEDTIWGALLNPQIPAGEYYFWVKIVPTTNTGKFSITLSTSNQVSYSCIRCQDDTQTWNVTIPSQEIDAFSILNDGSTFVSNPNSTYSIVKIEFATIGSNQRLRFNYEVTPGITLYFGKVDQTMSTSNCSSTYLNKIAPTSAVEESYVVIDGINEGSHFIYVIAHNPNNNGSSYYAKFRSDNFIINTSTWIGTKRIGSGDPVGLLPHSGEKEGYQLSGWKSSSTATAMTVTADSSPVNVGVTYWPVWTPNTYTVAYNGNGATGGSTSSSSHTYGVAKALTTNGFVKTGYAFEGWARSASGAVEYSNEQSVTNLSVVNNATVNLYAKWNVCAYVVSYTDGTSKVEKDSVSYTTTGYMLWQDPGNSFNIPTGNAWTGYWLFNGTKYRVGTPYNIADIVAGTDLIYKNGELVFELELQTASVTVTFNKNATNATAPSPASKSVTYGNTYGTLATTTRAGYNFAGWWTAASGGSQVYATTTMNQTSAHTLYAHWTEVKYSQTVNISTLTASGSTDSTIGGSVSVVYATNDTGGTQSATQTSTSGSYSTLSTKTISLTATPKDGYVFLGFSTSATAPAPTSKPSTTATYTVSGAKTYYAHFKKVSNNKLKYDSTQKYFYFEDGYFPQSYVGNALNSTINTASSSWTSDATWSVNGTQMLIYCNRTVSGTTYNLARIVAQETSTVTTSAGSTTFTAGTAYWFLIEPIRWRVSDYGVENTPNNWKTYGSYNANFTVVSDTVLWVSTFSDSEPTGAGYSASNDAEINNIFANMTSLTSGNIVSDWVALKDEGSTTIDDDVFNSETETPKVIQTTTTLTGSTLRVASMAEIKSCSSNMKAKASDLVAMLMGQSGDVKYWTRNLGQYYGNGNYVSVAGQPANGFYNNVYGVRFAMTMTAGSNAGF